MKLLSIKVSLFILTIIAIGCRNTNYSKINKPLALAIPAFPGAEGFGTYTTHGRGGKVIKVTNLNDSGPGSFREAIETSGKRIIVFTVGGIIHLKTKLNIFEPYCMIAGQTAPGDGICLIGSNINIATHDVVLRYIRVRPGDGEGTDPEDRDGIEVYPFDAPDYGYPSKAYNIVIDHCSVSWGIDENVSFYGSLIPTDSVQVHDITLQWSIVSECLADSRHPKGSHSKGILVAGGAYQISMHHNLLAHNEERHPLFKTGTNGTFVNNVLYNEPWGIGLVNEDGDYDHPNLSGIDIIGNYVKEGVNSDGIGYILNLEKKYLSKPSKYYVKGNITKNRTLESQDEWDATRTVGFTLEDIKAEEPIFDSTQIATSTAFEAYKLVLEQVGCNIPVRDVVDNRIINEVKTGGGHFIDSQTEVGGFPEYKTGKVPDDIDNDGMPDSWEKQYGDIDASGFDVDKNYTNIEMYLNSLVQI